MHEVGIVFSEYATLGVMSDSPKKICEKAGLYGQQTITLEVFPQSGHFYLLGVRGIFSEGDPDVRLTFLHPQRKEPLTGFQAIPGRDLVVVDDEPNVFYVPLTSAREVPYEVFHCSKDAPLMIEAEGDAFVNLVFCGYRQAHTVDALGQLVPLFQLALTDGDSRPSAS
jgi:hypothetical protein